MTKYVISMKWLIAHKVKICFTYSGDRVKCIAWLNGAKFITVDDTWMSAVKRIHKMIAERIFGE